jgi:hypothetical protein
VCRTAFLRKIDPAEWYMRQEEPAEPRPMRGRGWTSCEVAGPLVLDRSTRAYVPPTKGGPESQLDRRAFESNFGPYLARKSQEVIEKRSTTVRTNKGTVRARLVHFPKADILDIETATPSGQSVGRMKLRIDPEGSAAVEETVLGFLRQKMLELGADCRLLPD